MRNDSVHHTYIMSDTGMSEIYLIGIYTVFVKLTLFLSLGYLLSLNGHKFYCSFINGDLFNYWMVR
jgi:hypothetical protein